MITVRYPFFPSKLLVGVIAVLLLHGEPTTAENAAQILVGPDATDTLLAEDSQEKDDLLGTEPSKSWSDWKASVVERTGLDFGIDYNTLGYVASSSPGKDRSASGAFRFFGTWDLIERDGPNTGSIVFKFENRHRYGSVAPTDFGGELGYPGLLSAVFSNQGWRTTHLYWRQSFADGRGVSYIGWLDVTDYTDVYALASPWSGFSNLAFQTGSGTIGGLPDGALGAMVGGFLNDNYYLAASIADANADQTDILDGFDTLFNDGETYKSFEIGRTSGREALFVNNRHLTFWQIDERDEAETSDGYGVAFSFTQAVGDNLLPFVRGGWAKDGGSLYERALSIGLGYSNNPSRSLLGIGLNWSRPNESTFGSGLGDQYTLEVFQQWQITENLAITPSVQFIKDPAFNPDKDAIALFGLRLRAAF